MAKASSDAVSIGKRSRRKGHAWERRVAAAMRVLFGDDVKRSFQFRGGYDGGCDVQGTPFAIECKTGKSIGWLAAYEQVLGDSDGSRPPLVVGHYTDGHSLVMMGLETFVAMVVALSRSAPPDPEGVESDCRRIIAHVTGEKNPGAPEGPGDVQRTSLEAWKAFLPSHVRADRDGPASPRKRGNRKGGDGPAKGKGSPAVDGEPDPQLPQKARLVRKEKQGDK